MTPRSKLPSTDSRGLTPTKEALQKKLVEKEKEQ